MSGPLIHEITPALRSKRKSLLAAERPLAGVIDLLKSLQDAGHSLALWTVENSEHEKISDKVERLGLTPYFNFVGQADNAGHGHVPDCLLASTLKGLQVARQQVAFVGHTLPEGQEAVLADSDVSGPTLPKRHEGTAPRNCHPQPRLFRFRILLSQTSNEHALL